MTNLHRELYPHLAQSYINTLQDQQYHYNNLPSDDDDTISEQYIIDKLSQQDDIKQAHQNVLICFIDTLQFDTYYTLNDIMTKYNSFIKSNIDDNDTISYNILSIKSTMQLGMMLKDVNTISKHRKKINGKCTVYYTRS